MEQLNDNQLIVLEWMQKRVTEYNERVSTIIYFLTIHYPYAFDSHGQAKKAFSKLTKAEERQVIQIFLEKEIMNNEQKTTCCNCD